MNKIIRILILFCVTPFFLNGQCTIEDFEIMFCNSEEFIDLTFYEPNPDGTYTYSENGIIISDPVNFELSGNTELLVTFTEFVTGCTIDFTIFLLVDLPQYSGHLTIIT